MTRQERKEQTAFNHMVQKHGHALVNEPANIIPYTREQLYDLNDEVAPDTGISFAEMLDDLKIEYNA